MNHKKRTFRPLHIAYLLALFGMIAIIVAASVTKTKDYNNTTEAHFDEISDAFHTTPDGDDMVDFSHLGQYASSDGKTVTLYCRLPDIKNNTSLIFRSKDVYTSVYIGERLIYETNVPDSRFYNQSPGNLWNTVSLDKTYSGEMLTLKIGIVYDTNAVTVDHFFLGESINIISNFLNTKFSAILISILMIFIGLYLMVLDHIPRHRSIHTTHGLFYLGIYASLIGIWSLLETNTLQFFVSDQRILQMVNNMVMILDTLPMFLYLDCEYNSFKNPLIKTIYIADLIYVFVCIICQITGIYDFHHLLLGSQIALIAGTLIISIFIVHTFLIYRKKKMNSTPVMLQLIGVASLFFTAMFTLTKYSTTDTMDRASTVRLGMLFFIIFFSVSNQLQTNHLVEQGLKYDFVNTLAYSDGLTSLGNRTAYLEQLDTYGSSKLPELGIVFLDINDLKKVNDSRGHVLGDELIKEASVIIRDSFGQYGKSYRIGGDEFCVLFATENTQSIYETALEQFNRLQQKVNENNPYNLDIHIAHGFSICIKPTNENIKEAIAVADHAMYEDKAKIKQLTL